MLNLKFDKLTDGGTILCLGAHCDDVEIGCGGALIELAQKFPKVQIQIVIFCSDVRREKETRRSLSNMLGESASITMTFAELKDGYLPYQGTEAKSFLSECSRAIEPDLIFTHSRADLHQDHRFVGEITYQVFRDSLIFEMEIPKYDGDLGRPNVYSPISSLAAKRKVDTLIQCYESQLTKHWFTREVFMGLLRIRGLECRSESGLAEAFYVSKLVLK